MVGNIFAFKKFIYVWDQKGGMRGAKWCKIKLMILGFFDTK